MDLDRETTVKRDRLQGHLPEGDDLLPRRHGKPSRHTDHRQRQHAQDGRDFFYCANEGISITENAARIGLPVPENLRKVMKQLKGK